MLAVLRVAYAVVYRVDSDEPQHLHVVWEWTQGKLPYRDFFDNHTPLFQALCAPLMKLFGERADIVVWMRMAMVPLFVICLWAVYRIAATLYSRRVAIWAVILAGLWPNFLLTATEFRTDDLWVALWLVALALMVREPFTARRAFAVGLVFGAAFAVSMKTSLMLLAVALALATGALVRRLAGEKIDWRVFAGWLGAFVAGLAIVPGAVGAWQGWKLQRACPQVSMRRPCAPSEYSSRVRRKP